MTELAHGLTTAELDRYRLSAEDEQLTLPITAALRVQARHANIIADYEHAVIMTIPAMPQPR